MTDDEYRIAAAAGAEIHHVLLDLVGEAAEQAAIYRRYAEDWAGRRDELIRKAILAGVPVEAITRRTGADPLSPGYDETAPALDQGGGGSVCAQSPG